MNYLRKMKKNAKALSPVVASIILIAVTVAVSIAVAAWMGGMTTGFMQTEQLAITNVYFQGTDNATSTIVLTVNNIGTTDVSITSATVNDLSRGITGSGAIAKNSVANVTLTSPWTSSSNYQMKLISTKGNYYTFNGIAP